MQTDKSTRKGTINEAIRTHSTQLNARMQTPII